MTDFGEDPLGAVVPFERYRDVTVAGLAVRMTVPDGVQETGAHGVAPTVAVYELVDGEQGRFIANVFRLDSTYPPLARFNVHFQSTLGTDGQDAVLALASEWWRRRRGWKAAVPARRSAPTRRGR